MLMDWLGHQDSAMIRIYYRLHDLESRNRMNSLDFLGGAGGRSDGNDDQGSSTTGDAEPNIPSS
jgi:hypothetical protein